MDADLDYQMPADDASRLYARYKSPFHTLVHFIQMTPDQRRHYEPSSFIGLLSKLTKLEMEVQQVELLYRICQMVSLVPVEMHMRSSAPFTATPDITLWQRSRGVGTRRATGRMRSAWLFGALSAN